MYRKPKNGLTPHGIPESTQGGPAPSLDDDPELAHIARFSPPELEVGPDAQCTPTRDLPPPMIRPAESCAHESNEPGTSEPTPKAVIEHIPPLGPLAERETPEADVSPTGGRKKIRAFEQRMGNGMHEDNWNRTPNVTGTGAIHVKSFHCKLTGDSLEFLDRQVNEWLDAHPQYEVKQVTTSVGDWSGKTREPALIVNVWV